MPEAARSRVAWLADETDVAGFRRQARQGLVDGVSPSQLAWRVAASAEPELFDHLAHGEESARITGDTTDNSKDGTTVVTPPITVPAFFVPLVEKTALHADPNRFGLLYRLLWRLVHDRAVRHDPLDPDRQQAEVLARAVRRDMHKMTAFVRFRPLASADGQRLQHVAWFEPEHHIVDATAPFFARRFAQMHWAILTPRRCVRWDGQALRFGPGADRNEAPAADAAEQLWLTYYASIFNPARLKLAMMQKEMPRRYWKNLPEAALIQPLVASAAQRADAMVEQAVIEPARRRPASSQALAVDARPVIMHAAGSLAELRHATEHCRECPIGALATQAVHGEGPEDARLMLVGEQPGDREDLAGRPFVGPAGQLLDRALTQLGWPRDQLYVTNAVKHFKYQLRGKRRIHKTPAQQEAAACLHWLEREISIVKPRAVIALGATAARALLGRDVLVSMERGQWFTRGDGLRVLVTLHPAALLRAEPGDQHLAFERWLADLALAA